MESSRITRIHQMFLLVTNETKCDERDVIVRHLSSQMRDPASGENSAASPAFRRDRRGPDGPGGAAGPEGTAGPEGAAGPVLGCPPFKLSSTIPAGKSVSVSSSVEGLELVRGRK